MKTNFIKNSTKLFVLIVMSLFLISCDKDGDDSQTSLNTNYIGVYKVNSIKSSQNLRTGGYIGNDTELIPHFTCNEITLNINTDFTFIWNAQKIYQDFVYDSNDVIQTSSDLQCTPLTVNGIVTKTTDTSISLQFLYNNTQQTAILNLVNGNWQYQSTQDVFFMGHASLVDGVDTFFSDVTLTMVYEKL